MKIKVLFEAWQHPLEKNCYEILQNISFCVLRKEVSHKWLEQHKVKYNKKKKNLDDVGYSFKQSCPGQNDAAFKLHSVLSHIFLQYFYRDSSLSLSPSLGNTLQ